MRLSACLAILSASLLLSAGSCMKAEPEVVRSVEYIERDIRIVPRPSPVNMLDVTFKVVTENNLDSFLEYMKKNSGTGEVVFVGITVRDYENLSMNVEELKRYIVQQKSVIVYYESLAKP